MASSGQSETSTWHVSILTPLLFALQDKRAAKALRPEMKDADTNQDGMISFIEFLGYFQKMARYRADLARTQRLESYGRPRDLPLSKPSSSSSASLSSSSCSCCSASSSSPLQLLDRILRYFQKMARYRADVARTQHLKSYGHPRDLSLSKYSVVIASFLHVLETNPSFETNTALQYCFK